MVAQHDTELDFTSVRYVDVHMTASAQTAYGVCSEITNEGAQSSGKRGVADRQRQKRRKLER